MLALLRLLSRRLVARVGAATRSPPPSRRALGAKRIVWLSLLLTVADTADFMIEVSRKTDTEGNLTANPADQPRHRVDTTSCCAGSLTSVSRCVYCGGSTAAVGKETSIVSPPSRRASVRSSASWALAIAWAIESPRP